MLIGAVVGWGLVTNSFAGWLAWQGYLLGPFGLGGREGSWAYANLGVLAALLIGFVGTVLLGRRTVEHKRISALSRRPGGGSSRMTGHMPLPSRDAADRWLMIIDMQRIFGEPSQRMGHAGLCIGRGWDPATAAHSKPVSASHGFCRPSSRRCLDHLLRAVALCSRP